MRCCVRRSSWQQHHTASHGMMQCCSKGLASPVQRSVAWVVALLLHPLLLFSSCRGVAPAAGGSSTPPHLIFCLVDDLGYYNVGFHNPDQISPEIDALAAEGVVLEAFYTFKYCSPTRSSFLSGRLPIHVNQLLPGAINNPGGIDLRMTLLPQKLKQAGYLTHQIGKWHCGARSVLHLPVNRGFDSHFGFLGGGEDHYQNKGKQPVDLWRDHAPAYGENGTYSCELYSTEALRVVTQHDPKDPLFLYVAYQNTHTPYECPVQYQDPAQNFSTRRIVQGMLTCVSISVGNLTRALKSKGMWDTTLFVFSGDNGGPQYWGSNNHPLRGGKWTDFQGGIRNPAFAAGGWIPAHMRGSTVNGAMHIADMYTTFCSLAGVADCSDNVDGVPPTDGIDVTVLFQQPSSLNTVVGNATSPRHEIVISSNTIIVGEWKYVRDTPNDDLGIGGQSSGYWTGPVWPWSSNHSEGPGYEPDPGCPEPGCLFHLPSDPEERHECGAQFPAKLQELVARLKVLAAGQFQTGKYTAGYDRCFPLDVVAAAHHNFVAPPCVKGLPIPRCRNKTNVPICCDQSAGNNISTKCYSCPKCDVCSSCDTQTCELCQQTHKDQWPPSPPPAPAPSPRPRNETCKLAHVFEGQNIVGEDIRSHSCNSTLACAAACCNEPRCKAFTLDVRKNRCWLKDGHHRPVPKDGCTSGNVTAHGGPSPPPRPNPPHPAPAPAPPPAPPSPSPFWTPVLNFVATIAHDPNGNMRDPSAMLQDPVSKTWHFWVDHMNGSTQPGWHAYLHHYSAPAIVGPWTLSGPTPALPHSSDSDAWDFAGSFSPSVIYEPEEKLWYLFYSASGKNQSKFNTCAQLVASAASPEGPWTKLGPVAVPTGSPPHWEGWNAQRLDSGRALVIGGRKGFWTKGCSGAVGQEGLYLPHAQRSWAPPYAEAAGVNPLFAARNWCLHGYENCEFFRRSANASDLHIWCSFHGGRGKPGMLQGPAPHFVVDLNTSPKGENWTYAGALTPHNTSDPGPVPGEPTPVYEDGLPGDGATVRYFIARHTVRHGMTDATGPGSLAIGLYKLSWLPPAGDEHTIVDPSTS